MNITLKFPGRPCIAWLVLWSLLIPSGVARPTPAAEAPTQPLRYRAGDELLSLAGEWRFQPGDDVAWAAPGYDDGHWQTISVPGRWPAQGYPEHEQLAWYRIVLQLEPETSAAGARQSLGIGIGKILSAYEVYAGGRLLGGVGKLPPMREVNYNHVRVYALPGDAVDDRGKLVLALRVWGGPEHAVRRFGAGPYAGEFAVGDYTELLMRGYLRATPGLLAGILIAGFGLYHLYLYHRNRQLYTLLWFGIMALLIALYTLMENQWKYAAGNHFMTYEKLKFTAIYLFPAVGIQSLWSLVDKRIGWPLRLYQLSFVFWALLVVAVPGLTVPYLTLHYWQWWVMPLLAVAAWLILSRAREGHPEARTMLLGTIIFIATCCNDMLIDLARLDLRRLLPFGFMAVALSMAVSLANRFTGMFNQLEAEVEERTLDLQQANRRLEEASLRDPLTGMLNRRGFLAEAEAEVRRHNRSGRSLSIVLADIDRFKHFNDRHGHACGDHVLQHAADCLRRHVRDVDHVGRWGGEEFIILLPETGDDGAAVLAEKLRAGVAAHSVEYEGGDYRITMTFGIAVHRRGESLETCIARADTALYAGKERGRNRVMIGSYRGLTVVS